PEIGTRKRALDVPQAIVAGVASAALELDLTWQQIQLIVQYQHLLGHQLVKPQQGACGLTRTVHEGGRLGDDDGLALVTPLGHPGREGFYEGEGGVQVIGQMIGKPEARVMAGRFVFRAWVTQAYDQAYRKSHDQSLHKKNPRRLIARQGL